MSEPEAPETSPLELFSLSQIRHLMRVEFSRAQRYEYPLACLVLQVEGLERIRDERGYEAVEAAVAVAVETLQRATRVCDHLGRLPGDQLVAVLPHTDLAGARTLADRLVESGRALPGAAAGLRLSVGGTHYAAENTLFFDALLETAESALRQAVEGGGDRTVFLDPGAA